MDMKIKKSDLIGEVLKKNPKVAEVFIEAGLQCICCPMMYNETIEEGCKAHGMNERDIKKLIEKINKEIRG